MKLLINKWLLFFGALFLLCTGIFLGHYSASLYSHTQYYCNKIHAKVNACFTDMSAVPVIQIHIPEKTFEELSQIRDEAVKKGFLLKAEKNFIEAEIHYQDSVFPIKLRLKGDWSDHFRTDKWSMRIKSDTPIMEMNKFSIQHPSTRKFLAEWFFHKALAHEGLIALRYYFVKVMINGNDQGIYALEEFFDDELLKENNDTTAPILKFNEDNIWSEMEQYIDSGVSKGHMYNNLAFQTIDKSYVDAFNLDDIIKDSTANEQLKYAKDLLYNFLDSLLPASKVFDTEKSPRFLALCEALGAEHALFWHNLRFYFNPQTKLLEPIGFDAFISEYPEKVIGQHLFSNFHTDTYIRLLLNDSVFTKKYIYWLNYYTQPAFLNNLQKEFSIPIQQNLDILHTEWPEVTLPTDIWEENRKLIQLALNPPTAFYAYLKDTTNNKISIQIDNISALPIEISGLQLNDSTLIKPTANNILLRYPQRTEIVFPFNLKIQKLSNLSIRYRILGLSNYKTQKIIPYARQ